MHEQAVEIALGPKGAFESGSVGTLTRRISTDRVVNVAVNARRPAKLSRQPKKPRVVELLRMAQEWRREIDSGEVQSQAEIARREGVTRARVTQILAMLRLAPEIQEDILTLPESINRSPITEHALRSVVRISDHPSQIAAFHAYAE